MREKHRLADYKAARAKELAANHEFHHGYHRIHQLMNLFLGVIICEWLVEMIAQGPSWAGVLEILLAIAIHVIVETLTLHGWALIGGLIVLADELSSLVELLRESGLVGLESLFAGACSLVLTGIGIYLIASPLMRTYARRAREIVRTYAPHNGARA